MAKRKGRLTATEALRQAISKCDWNFLQLQQRSGVPRQSIMKFVRGEQSLRLDAADKLMAVLGVEVRLEPKPARGKARKPRSKPANK